ncbi:MAG: DUF1080 domain-containing protein, partial [Acidobacteriota bacterium]
MFKYPVCVLTAFWALFGAAPLAAEEGWRALFNGENLSGWEQVGPGRFTVENGALRTHGGMGLLWYTPEKIGNAVIRIVYRSTTRGANSGVFIRIPEPPKDPWYAVHNGYEVQILDESDRVVFDEFHRTGAIYSLSKATTFPPSEDGWNTMEIKLAGQRTVVVINGITVNEFDPSQPVPPRKYRYEPERGPRPDVGYIGLQNHNAESTVYFKEVSVRSLQSEEGFVS